MGHEQRQEPTDGELQERVPREKDDVERVHRGARRDADERVVRQHDEERAEVDRLRREIAHERVAARNVVEQRERELVAAVGPQAHEDLPHPAWSEAYGRQAALDAPGREGDVVAGRELVAAVLVVDGEDELVGLPVAVLEDERARVRAPIVEAHAPPLGPMAITEARDRLRAWLPHEGVHGIGVRRVVRVVGEVELRSELYTREPVVEDDLPGERSRGDENHDEKGKPPRPPRDHAPKPRPRAHA